MKLGQSLEFRRFTVILVVFLLPLGCGGSNGSGDVGGAASNEVVVDPDAPGIRQTGPNRFEVVVMAFEGGFDPTEVRVPVGAEVTFRVRSADVSHGLLIEGTDVALEAPEGADFSQATYTFSEPGEYPFLCHVYCIGGHESMTGVIIVE